MHNFSLHYQLTLKKRANICVFSTLENSFRGRITGCAHPYVGCIEFEFNCETFNDEHAHRSLRVELVVVFACSLVYSFDFLYARVVNGGFWFHANTAFIMQVNFCFGHSKAGLRLGFVL